MVNDEIRRGNRGNIRAIIWGNEKVKSVARGMGRKRYTLFKVEHGQDFVEILSLRINNFVNMYVKVTSNDEVCYFENGEKLHGIGILQKILGWTDLVGDRWSPDLGSPDEK